MKWIGQHIWDLISRFRSDIYMEDISTGTIASGCNLGLDSSNKVVKANVVGTVVVTDSNNASHYPVVFHDESNNLLDDTGALTYSPGLGVLSLTNDVFGQLSIKNTSSLGASPGRIWLQNSKGASASGGSGAVNDELGQIVFRGQNDKSPTPENLSYGSILTYVGNPVDNAEGGIMVFKATTGNGSTSTPSVFLKGTGHATLNKVDVEIGANTNSITQVKGKLKVDTSIITGSDDKPITLVPPMCYNTTTIKVMPNEFMINDDTFDSGGIAYATFDDDVVAMGIKVSNATTELITFVKIPVGYKVTHVQVHGTTSTSNACRAYSFNYQTGARSNGATYEFDINENKDITDIVGSATNDLCLEIAPASNTDVIMGATVTIINT